MSVHHYDYIIVANPPASRGEGSDEPLSHHVRLKHSSCVSANQLMEEMHRLEPNLSVGTCITAVSGLARALGQLLADGHSVEVPGVGVLHPSLSGRVTKTARGLAASDVHISGVRFTPSSELLAEANEGKATFNPHGLRLQPSDEEVEAFLTEYFAQHERLTRKALVMRFGLTRYQTLVLLRRLVSEGRLRPVGSRATACYICSSQA